jgi:peptide/nickel transport system substrate-binding protein
MTIRLRPGVKFHDDTPVTSGLVVDILRKSLPSFMGATFDDVGAIDAQTDTTIHITFRRPSPFLIEALEASIRKPNDPLGGTGPFIPDAGDAPRGMHRNDAYYLGRAHIANIAVTTFPNVRAAWAEMLRGGLDMLWEVGPDALDSLKGSTEIKTYNYVRHYQYLLAFNPKFEALRAPDVRIAMNEAVDRAALIRDAMDGHGVASSSLVWPSHWAFRSDLSQFAFDPQRAAARLSSRTKGKQGLRFTCLVGPEATDERVAVIVRRQLEAVGVTMDVKQAPPDQILKAFDSGDFEAVLFETISAPSAFSSSALSRT